MATIRELFVKVGADIGDFTRNMASAAVQAGRFGESVQASSKTVQQASQASARAVQQSSQITTEEVTRAAAAFDEQYGKMSARAKKTAVDVEEAAERTGTAASGLSRRMNSVSVGVLFAFDAMTRSAQAGEGAWRRVFRSMSLLALAAFDPPAGIIVAGILAATDAIIDAFNRQERAAEKAKRTFIEASIEIARSGDIIKASQQKALIYSGDPFALRGQGKNAVTGEQVPSDESAQAFEVRHRGLLAISGLQDALNQKIAQQSKLLDDAGRKQDRISAENLAQSHLLFSWALPSGALKDFAKLLDQRRELNVLADQYNTLNKQAGDTFDIVNKKTADLAAAMLRIAQDTKIPKDVAQEAQRILSIFDELNKRHAATIPIANAVLSAYDKVEAQLGRLRAEGKGVFDPLVESLMRAEATFQKSPLVQMLRLGQIPSAGTAVQQMFQGAPGPVAGQNLSVPFGMTPDQFAQSGAARAAEAIREALVNALARGAIQPVTAVGGGPLSVSPISGPITQTQVIVQTIKDRVTDTLSNFGQTLSATLMSSFGPIALLMRAMEPALRTLTPLFDRLAVPIALVAQVLVASLLPVIRALYPVVRLLGIAITLVGEVMARVSAAIAQAVGGLIKAIGNLIAKIPGLGGVGHAIANFGQSILNFAAGQKEAADQMAAARKQLEGMSWDATAQALDNLQGSAQNAADALTNIPQGFKIQRAIFLASQPVNAADVGAGPNSSASGASNYFAPGSIVIVGSTKSAQQLLDEVTKAARQTAMARTGSTADAADVIG